MTDTMKLWIPLDSGLTYWERLVLSQRAGGRVKSTPHLEDLMQDKLTKIYGVGKRYEEILKWLEENSKANTRILQQISNQLR